MAEELSSPDRSGKGAAAVADARDMYDSFERIGQEDYEGITARPGGHDKPDLG